MKKSKRQTLVEKIRAAVSAFLILLVVFGVGGFSVSAEASPVFCDDLWFNGNYDTTLGDMAGRRLYVYGIAEALGKKEPESDGDIHMMAPGTPDRLDMALMLYRICADHEPAKLCPFTDVPEEYIPAVSWLYQKGVTRGIAPDLFGVGEISRAQFLTMLSRLFSWDMSELEYENWNLGYEEELSLIAEEKGLLPCGVGRESFTRGDMYLTLLALLEQFYPEKCVSVKPEMSVPNNITLAVDSLADAEAQISAALGFAPYRITVCFSDESPEEEIAEFVEQFSEENRTLKRRYAPMLYTDGWFAYAFRETSERNFTLYYYRYTPAYLSWLDMSDWLRCYRDTGYSQAVQKFYQERIIPLASIEDEYSRICRTQELICQLASYDWREYDSIIRNLDSSNPDSHSIAGFLNDGLIVCDGYAKTFTWILRCLGMDSIVVYGIGGENRDNHAWNKVKIGDAWYNMDVCWRDTGCGNEYFLKSDSYFMNRLHSFNDSDILEVFSSNSNYFW